MLQTFPFVNYFPGVTISSAVACVLALVIRVLPSLLFRLKLSFCLMKYASKGVVSKKKIHVDHAWVVALSFSWQLFCTQTVKMSST